MKIDKPIPMFNAIITHKIAGLDKEKSSKEISSNTKKEKIKHDPSIISMDQKVKKQNRGLIGAITNTDAGISCMQTADFALREVNSILQRMNEIAMQASKDTLTDKERELLQKEIDQSMKEINNIADTTTFGGQKLFDGTIKEEGYTDCSITTSTITVSNPVERPAIIDLMGNKFYLHGSDQALTDEEAKEHILAGNDVFLNPASKDNAITDIRPNTVAVDLLDKNGIFSYIVIGNQKVTNSELGVTVTNIEDLALYCKYEFKNYDFAVDGTKLLITAKNGAIPATVNIKWNKKQHNFMTFPGLDPDYKPIENKPAQIKAENGKDYFYRPASIDTVTSTSIVHNQVITHVDDRYYKRFHFQVSDEPATYAAFTIDRMNTEELGLKNIDVTTMEKAKTTQKTVQKAIEKIDKQRQSIGSAFHRFGYTEISLKDATDHADKTITRIEDTDMDEESVTFANSNIISAFDEAMLSQANQTNERALGLLIG